MSLKKILVVDDEPDNISFVKAILEDEGYIILSTNDGIKGFNSAKENKPDLIILDIQMPPGPDGFNVFYDLRHEPETDQIPVIFLTAIKEITGVGYSTSEIREFAGTEPEGYVEKPISPEKLVEVVSKLLSPGLDEKDI